MFDRNLRVAYGQFFERWVIAEVAYEKVARHNGVAAAHIYGACQHALLAECQVRSIPVHLVHVSTWKSKIGLKSGGKDTYIDRVNELTGKSLTMVNEDEAAAIAIGYAAFVAPTAQSASK